MKYSFSPPHFPKFSESSYKVFSLFQAIGESYDLKIENFSSLVDGKAMWCLLDYYFRKEHHGSSIKVLIFQHPYFIFSRHFVFIYLSSSCWIIIWQDLDETNEAISLVSTNEYTDAVHNFILSQKLTSLLGNFPEVSYTPICCIYKQIIIYLISHYKLRCKHLQP